MQNKKIKVLVVTPTLECGGAERFVSLLCRYLQVPEIELVLTVINNRLPFYQIPDNVKIIDLGKSGISKSFFALRTVIKKEKPAIVFTTANHLNLFAAIFKGLLPKNITWVARETSVVSVNAKYAASPRRYTFLLKRFYHRLDHIICQSAFMQDDLVQHYHIDRDKTSIIYNAVDPAFHFYEGQVLPHTFITVARLSKEKGIDRILEVLSQLPMPFNYYIAGDGIEGEALKELAVKLGIADKVHFMGALAKPFAGKENCQLYLCGSLYEGFPNAVIEANVTGIPAIAFNVPGGIDELITDGHNGFKADNENDFLEKMITATRYTFNRRLISETAIANFSIDKMTGAVSRLLLKLYYAKSEIN